jgi:hypothetical protein
MLQFTFTILPVRKKISDPDSKLNNKELYRFTVFWDLMLYIGSLFL